MGINKYMLDGKNYVSVYTDKSHSSGCLHFSCELSVVFEDVSGELVFISAWCCGVSEEAWNSDEESDFEACYPGLLAEMRRQAAM